MSSSWILGRWSAVFGQPTLYFVAFLLVFPALEPPARTDEWVFTDVTVDAGLNYQHGYAEHDMLGFMTGGVAAGDYDGDGHTDLYVIRGNIGPNLLFRGFGDGTFEEVGATAGTDLAEADGSGPTFADLDGDGCLDLFVGGINGHPSVLFRNRCDGTFEAMPESGLDLHTNVIGAAFGDYDQDGDLDAFLTHWGTPKPAFDSTAGVPLGSTRHLFANNGKGQFTDVSIEAGITQPYVLDLNPLAENTDYSFTANFADIDDDSWLDLLITGDFGTSTVFLNKRDGTFAHVTDPAVITDKNGMGASVGDYDNDGDLDWFVTSIYVASLSDRLDGNRLYRNDGNGVFSDVTDEAGVREGFWGWGSCFADFNNDGQLDIFHVNGFTEEPQFGLHFDVDPSRLFINNGDGSFTETSALQGIHDTGQGRGISCFDADHDGDIDIFITNVGQPLKFYRNDLDNGHRYLKIKLVGTTPNRDAIGARIYVRDGWGREQMRELRYGSNYISQNPVEAHFGVGESLEATVHVLWPDGNQTDIGAVVTNQALIVRHPEILRFYPPKVALYSCEWQRYSPPRTGSREASHPCPSFWKDNGSQRHQPPERD